MGYILHRTPCVVQPERGCESEPKVCVFTWLPAAGVGEEEAAPKAVWAAHKLHRDLMAR